MLSNSNNHPAKGLFSKETEMSETSQIPLKDPDNACTTNSNTCSSYNANNITNYITLNCALSFYCICFSIIKTCNYWKTDTLDFISEHGKIIYSQNLANLTANNFPKTINIYNAEVHVTFKTEHHGNLWYNSHNDRLELEKTILQKY